MMEPASMISPEAFSPMVNSFSMGLSNAAALPIVRERLGLSARYQCFLLVLGIHFDSLVWALFARQDQDTLPAVAGIALALLGGAAVATRSASSSGADAPAKAEKSAPEVVEKIDVSIPYDAAARLAYRELKGLGENANYDEKEFQKFKEAYETTTVANVIVKKMERDLIAAQVAAQEKSKELASMF
jgi:hypothetical protein